MRGTGEEFCPSAARAARGSLPGTPRVDGNRKAGQGDLRGGENCGRNEA
jgi:hypothetical protein